MDNPAGEEAVGKGAGAELPAGNTELGVVRESDEDPGKAAKAAPRPAPGPATENWCWRVLCANWCTRWVMDEELRALMPPRHSDYRDSLPLPLEEVYAAYRPHVQDGKWTMGLLRVREHRRGALSCAELLLEGGLGLRGDGESCADGAWGPRPAAAAASCRCGSLSRSR